jgi:glucose/arabinose dehydrogenase
MPVIEYSHGKGLAVIGGYVYRGSSIPGLRGTYIYADHSSQTVFSFEMEGDRAVNQRVLSDEFDLGSGNIYSFGQDALGEVYITRADGTIHKIVALSD